MDQVSRIKRFLSDKKRETGGLLWKNTEQVHNIDSFKPFSHGAQVDLLKRKFHLKGIDLFVKEFFNSHIGKNQIQYQFGAVIDD